MWSPTLDFVGAVVMGFRENNPSLAEAMSFALFAIAVSPEYPVSTQELEFLVEGAKNLINPKSSSRGAEQRA